MVLTVDTVISRFEEYKSDKDQLNSLFGELVRQNDVEGTLLAEVLGKDQEIRSKFIEYCEQDKSLFSIIYSHSDPQLRSIGGLLNEFSEVVRENILDQILTSLQGIYRNANKKNKNSNSNIIIIEDLEKGQFLLNCLLKCLTKDNVKVTRGLIHRILSIIILYGDRRLDQAAIISQVVLIISRCIEFNFENTESSLVSIVEDLIITDDEQNLICLFSLVSLMFHINVDIGERLFILESIQNKSFSEYHLESKQFIISALDLLSSSCVSKKCRALVAQNFGTVVQSALESTTDQSVQLLAASILVKTKANSETNQKEDTELLDELSMMFEDAVAEYNEEEEHETKDDDENNHKLNNNNDNYQIALEGLAYTSLMKNVKSRAINNSDLIKNLVNCLKFVASPNRSPWIYCTLCILVNVTQYKPKQSAEQQRLRDLKNYAGKSNLDNDNSDQEDSDEVVGKRCKIIMDTGIVGIISNNCPRFTKSSREMVVGLLRNLVIDKDNRAKFAQQGGLAVLIYLLLPNDSSSSNNSSITLDAKTINVATSALAKSLISIDPSIAFSTKISAIVAVKPLIEQLQCEASDIPLLDTFESLLALTNLASVDDSYRNQIIRLGWNKIETALTSSNSLVQRASIELICNLAMSPLCAEKYLDGSKPAISRLELLAAFTDTDDHAASTAAAGALALLTEWGEPAIEVMGHNKKTVNHLIDLLKLSDPDLRLRGISAVRNLVVGANEINDEEVFQLLKSIKAIDTVRAMVQSSRDNDTVRIALEVVKVLLEK